MILESLQQNDEVESVEPMSDVPTFKEWAKETLKEYRSRTASGSLVGQRAHHRSWPSGVYEAFLYAPVIKPAIGEIQRKLYGNLPKGETEKRLGYKS